MPLVAVLDADVLFSMYLRDTLLRLSHAGCFRPHWTDQILAEVTRNLVKKAKMKGDDAARLATIMSTAFEEARVENWEEFIPAVSNHPKDRHVAAAALAIKANVIVTRNIKDFKPLPDGLVAMTPDQFLLALFDAFPEEVVETIETQAAGYTHGPQTSLALLERLAKQAPVFAAAVSSHVVSQ